MARVPIDLDPAAHLRRFYDVHYFVWVLGWVARRLVEAPLALFDANLFYPYGLSLAYSEPMLLPAVLTAAPVYALTRNPILAYNVTVVLFQALAGWAAYYTASRLTGSRLAGWVGGIVFALSPFRTGYYQFAAMGNTRGVVYRDQILEDIVRPYLCHTWVAIDNAGQLGGCYVCSTRAEADRAQVQGR